MRPLEGNEEFCNNPSESGVKTAADLIMWTGPNIPCLELCTGDTIQKVIYDLALILCDISENVLDVTKLDFKCMLDDGGCPPDTLLEALQLMINSHCNIDFPSGEAVAGSLPIVNLPVCLHYKNTDGDTITSLRLDLYAKFLADTICKIIIDVKSLKSVVTNLTTQINTLNATLTGGGGSAGTSGTGTVTSKCLSAPTPGQVLPVSTAFANLETAMCSYIELLGTSTQWSTLIENQCITNTTLIPGSTSEKYSDLPGWIDSPESVVESMTNLWKVVCKLNEETTGSSSGGSACFPAAPSIAVDATTKVLSWSSPAPSTYSQPLGYKLSVKNSTTNAVVYTNNSIDGTDTSFDLSVYLTDTTVTYKIELIASYTCGDSTSGIALLAPASSGGSGGGVSTTGYRVKFSVTKGQDIYSNTTNTNPVISQASPFADTTVGCDCAPAQKFSANFFGSYYDMYKITNFADLYNADICKLNPLNNYLEYVDPFIPNTGPRENFEPYEASGSKWYAFKFDLVDGSTGNPATNATGKPIVLKIRTKRAFWKVNGAASIQPAGWTEMIVNIVIPVNATSSNHVKVYYVKGLDPTKACVKYVQCGFCFTGAFEGTTADVDGVIVRPTGSSLGTTLSSVGIDAYSFNTPILNLPTSCSGIL